VQIFRDHQGVPIRLTDERRRHMLEHPEMAGLENEIGHSLSAPDTVVQSVSDLEARLYYRRVEKTIVGPKHLCVVVKMRAGDAFIITAYLTDKVKKGQVLWPTVG
jgi:hypothetical protein